MRTIRLTADDGEMLTGQLPESWAEVPLAGYATLAGAEGLPARIEATAALVRLPAGPLLEDVNLFAVITQNAPWLFSDALPSTEQPVAWFTHQGITYIHVGNLDKISAGQMEALLTFLRANEGHALNCTPALLAVLYCPKGQQQTPEVVRDVTQAFTTLPMSLAWPALASFTGSSGTRALDIQTAFALRAQVENLLAELETSLATPGASTTFWQKVQRSVVRTWLRNVRKTL